MSPCSISAAICGCAAEALRPSVQSSVKLSAVSTDGAFDFPGKLRPLSQ